MTCTFFGHSDCHGLDEIKLERAIEMLISKGVDTFYVGHQGNFDSIVYACLKRLKATHPHISFYVVLAYPPLQKATCFIPADFTLFPEAAAAAPRRFAIDRRNRWMIDRSDFCLCYISHSWGGAYKFAHMAKRKGVETLNLGDFQL